MRKRSTENIREKERLLRRYMKNNRKRLHEEWLDEMIADAEPMPMALKLIIIGLLTGIIMKIIL